MEQMEQKEERMVAVTKRPNPGLIFMRICGELYTMQSGFCTTTLRYGRLTSMFVA